MNSSALRCRCGVPRAVWWARPTTPGRQGGSEDGGVEALLELFDRERHRRIRCPKCRWSPTKRDRWICSCRFVWNTFDTASRCPGCGRQWRDTQCPRCHQWSPHEDWYERNGDETS